MCAPAQRPSDNNGQTESGQQAQHKGAANDLGNLGDLVDVAADGENVAVRQRLGDKPHLFGLAAAIVDTHDYGFARDTGGQSARQALEIARDTLAIACEQARDPDAARIVAQPIGNVVQLPLGRIVCDELQLADDQIVEIARHVGGGLPIDEAEQQHGPQHEGAGDGKRPAKRRGAGKFTQAHGE